MTETCPTPTSQLEHVFLAHQSELRAFVKRKLGSDEEASDVLQELYLRIACNAQSSDSIIQPLGYLRKMAGNLSIDRLRSRSRHRQLFGQWDMSAIGQVLEEKNDLTPERVAVARERLQVVQGVLDRLPDDCRTAFLLSRCDGLTYDEISEHLGVSRNMVKKHLVRALSAVRAAMPLSK